MSTSCASKGKGSHLLHARPEGWLGSLDRERGGCPAAVKLSRQNGQAWGRDTGSL